MLLARLCAIPEGQPPTSAIRKTGDVGALPGSPGTGATVAPPDTTAFRFVDHAIATLPEQSRISASTRYVHNWSSTMQSVYTSSIFSWSNAFKAKSVIF